MSKKQETVADIAAEMRRECYVGAEYDGAEVHNLVDRIEAAHKREVGNGAKMRQALEAIKRKAISIIPGSSIQKKMLDCFRLLAKAALSEPPRNCDVGTVADQVRRYQAFCKRHRGCDECYIELNGETWDCELGWAQMPYEEGDEQ